MEWTRAVRKSRPSPFIRLEAQESQRQRPLPALWRWLSPYRWTEPQPQAVKRRRERFKSTQSLSERKVTKSFIVDLQNYELSDKKREELRAMMFAMLTELPKSPDMVQGEARVKSE